MDIESFSQCLMYMQATSFEKMPVDKFLPVAAALSGTGLGFFLNQFVARRKEEKNESNQKNCCEEDLHELMTVSVDIVMETLLLASVLANKQRPKSHNLPYSITLPFLEKYYPDIAHSFSVNQRYWVKEVFRRVKKINDYLDEFVGDDKLKSLFVLSRLIVHIQSTALEAYRFSVFFLKGESLNFSDGDQLLIQLGASEEQVKYINILKSNLEAGNIELHL